MFESVIDSVRRKIGGVPRVLLRDPDRGNSAREIAPLSVDAFGEDIELRYSIEGEINRGGMGSILLGRDVDLGRELAIKVLLEEHADRRDVIRRFIEEAQIGGQLQHPGIAPVYELGQFADGRPFFTMKLIDGQTLSELLAARSDLSEDRAKFLKIFEQVCQTIAYAHSRGVIHRDLKPANIMVGAFGEVQVMDWGLAKIIENDRQNPANAASDTTARQAIGSTFDLLRRFGKDSAGRGISVHDEAVGDSVAADGDSTDADRTALGSVMGTPAYMPPEQARGLVNQLNEHADVFGLGAILCEILTGHPPYLGDDKRDIATKAAAGQLDSCYQRINQSDAHADLLAFARRCLDPVATRRPKDAREVSHWLTEHFEFNESRLRQAELRHAADSARLAEESKRRRIVYLMSAVLIATISSLTAAWVWVNNQSHQIETSRLESELFAKNLRESLRQRIERDTSAAVALANQPFSDSPDRTAEFESAISAVRQAQSLAADDGLETLLIDELAAIESRLSTQKADLDLSIALEQAWDQELTRIDRHRSFVHRSGQLNDQVDESFISFRGIVERNPQVEAIPLYQSAFEAWGLNPDSVSRADAVERIASLPEPLRSRVIISIDRWYRLLDRVRTVRQWQEMDWSTLMPRDARSRASDTLTIEDDGTIFASGDEQRFGYEVEFETDVPYLPAIRLDALTDDRLPSGGPGRAEDGTFWLWAIQVFAAPRDQPDRKRKIAFHSATSDHCKPNSFVWIDYWNPGPESVGKGATLVFDAQNSLYSPSGFRIKLTTNDKVPSQHSESNLGRFRLSVPTFQHEIRIAHWLGQLRQSIDTDRWRMRLKNEIDRASTDALIKRAESQQKNPAQPDIILIQLAEMLRNQADRKILPANFRQFNWQPIEPQSIHSRLGAEFKPRRDGSIELSGGVSGNDVVEIRAKLKAPRLTAMTLRLITGKNGDGSGTGRFSRVYGNGLVVHEISAELSNDPEFKESIPVRFDRILTPETEQTVRRSNGTHLEMCIDGDPDTSYEIVNPTHDRIWLFPASHPPLQGDAYLRLRFFTGGDANANLGKFAIQVLTEDHNIADPLRTARELLESALAVDPSNYFLTRALTGLYGEGNNRDAANAFRYATAAVSLRPQSRIAREVLLLNLPTTGGQEDESRYQVALGHFQALKRLDPSLERSRSVLEQLIAQAEALLGQSRVEEALGKISLVMHLTDDPELLQRCRQVIATD